MRVLVTGGAGFIGSWTVEALVTAGHDVLVYDSLASGRMEYLRAVVGTIPIVRGDVCHALALHRAVRRFRPDAIIHLAGYVSVPRSLRRALCSHDVNTRGTLAVLEAARGHGVRRVVLASSAAVYGATASVPAHEEVPLQPLSPYALHKRIGEDYARLHAQFYGLEMVVLRYFNVYGPRQDPASPYSGVIARFAAGALTGRPVTITGDGTQTRDFVFVGDVARVNVAAETAAVGGHQVLNVGTGRETSVLDLHTAFELLTRRPLPYTREPPRPGDVYRSCANVTRLGDVLGVACATRLHDGLAALLDWLAQPDTGADPAESADSL